jgi:aspartate aminotransferase-like enzyme
VVSLKVEDELKITYKLMTFTHVDTSTAVRVDPEPLGALGEKYGVITVLDGVCSVAGEEIRQEEWKIDVVLTASQKAVGVPPGLAFWLLLNVPWRHGRREKPGAQLLQRLDPLAACDEGIRGTASGILRNPGGQPGKRP